jgi:syntaxin 5
LKTPSLQTSDSPLYSTLNGKIGPPSRTGTPSALLQPYGGETVYDSSTKGKGKQEDFLTLDMGPPVTSFGGSGGGQSYEQMQLLQQEDQSDSYYQSRGTAITQIESTIQELGGIFSQLATMVSMQADQVQRIDQDTFDVVNNVEGAQRELLRVSRNSYFENWNF